MEFLHFLCNCSFLMDTYRTYFYMLAFHPEILLTILTSFSGSFSRSVCYKAYENVISSRLVYFFCCCSLFLLSSSFERQLSRLKTNLHFSTFHLLPCPLLQTLLYTPSLPSFLLFLSLPSHGQLNSIVYRNFVGDWKMRFDYSYLFSS